MNFKKNFFFIVCRSIWNVASQKWDKCPTLVFFWPTYELALAIAHGICPYICENLCALATSKYLSFKRYLINNNNFAILSDKIFLNKIIRVG